MTAGRTTCWSAFRSRASWVRNPAASCGSPSYFGRSAGTSALRRRIPGFRTKTAAWLTDRQTGALAADAPLLWVRSENWYPDELAARGRFEGGLADRAVVLLGAGAFGSVLGDLLVRGGVHDLAVFDAGRLEAGNLARHDLTLLELRSNKAEALAAHLNTVSPSARVVGWSRGTFRRRTARRVPPWTGPMS